MKIENLKAANRTAERIKKNQQSVKTINRILKDHPNGDSDGTTSSEDKKLYGLYLNRYNDSSGDGANLSGSLVQTDVLKFTRDKLLGQIAADMKLMETY